MATAKCAVFAAFNHPLAAQVTYFGLHALQHRGQESAGISSFDLLAPDATASSSSRDIMRTHKGFGLVLDVFNEAELGKLKGDAAVGHTRYSTSGSDKLSQNIQPFTCFHHGSNFAVVHNGNISNFRELRKQLDDAGTLLSSTSDTELVLHLFSRSKKATEVEKLQEALASMEGAYSMVLMNNKRMYAVRDPNGFRPLCLGRFDDEKNPHSFCIASETCAFDLVGAKLVREIEPGEILVIDLPSCNADGKFASHKIPSKFGLSPCIFEFVYFARPDSFIFGANVDAVREQLGASLAKEAPVPKVGPDDPPVVVVAVPDSSNTAALGYTRQCAQMGLKCAYEIGIIRNHYVGRTFISPSQDERDIKVRCKFNPIKRVLDGKIVVLVDDSIVRGTTSKKLIKMVRDAGAKEVHFRVASPQVISPCYYGMDFPSHKELISNQLNRDVQAITSYLQADSVAFLSLEALKTTVVAAKTASQSYCTACFSAEYPVPVKDKDEVDSKISW